MSHSAGSAIRYLPATKLQPFEVSNNSHWQHWRFMQIM